jgi:multiple sugar transport system substrate-binding protein
MQPDAKLLSLVVALLLFWLARPASAYPETLRFVTFKSDTAQLWEQAIADFEKQNPGVKVVKEIAPNSSTQFHDLLTQKLKNGDTRLDVFFMDVVWPSEFASAGWALPLDRFFPPQVQSEFLDAAMAANRYRGQTFGVPLFVDAGLLYYRQDLLAKYRMAPPRHWPELVEQAKRILAAERDPRLSGYSGQFKQYEGLVCNMMEFILSNGGALWDAQRQTSALDHDHAKTAVHFVRDHIIGEIAHRGVLAYEEPESVALFTQGRAIFHRNWPYAWQVANDPKQSRVAGKVGMMPLPGFPGHRGASTLGGWQLGISRFSKIPDLAWRFVTFLTSHEMQKRVALAMGRAPARKALYTDAALRAKIPRLPALLEAFKQAVPRPTTPVYAPLSNIMQRYFSAALALPDSNIDQRAALAAREMNRVLDLLRGAAEP